MHYKKHLMFFLCVGILKDCIGTSTKNKATPSSIRLQKS